MNRTPGGTDGGHLEMEWQGRCEVKSLKDMDTEFHEGRSGGLHRPQVLPLRTWQWQRPAPKAQTGDHLHTATCVVPDGDMWRQDRVCNVNCGFLIFVLP